MITTPGAPGGRPPDQLPTPQRLFPSATKAGSAVVPVDSVGGSIDEGLLESALSVLGTTYDEQEVLAAVLPQCTSLVDRDLADNTITTAGAGKLVDAQEKCSSLTCLNLEQNCLGQCWENLITGPHTVARHCICSA